jgi:hypothetical protein
MGKYRRRKSMTGITAEIGGIKPIALSLLNKHIDTVTNDYIHPMFKKDFENIAGGHEDMLALDEYEKKHDPTSGNLTNLFKLMILYSRNAKSINLFMNLNQRQIREQNEIIDKLKELLRKKEQEDEKGSLVMNFDIGKPKSALVLTRMGVRNIYIAWYYFYYHRNIPQNIHIDPLKYKYIVDVVNAIGTIKDSDGISPALLLLAKREKELLERSSSI